jgi:transcriptional regulator with XRE-family HTH domain
MNIGQNIRRLRQASGLSQGDIEKRTGLLSCYVSRVENGHTVPSLQTLEKLAGVFGLELWQLLQGVEEVPPPTEHGPLKQKGPVDAELLAAVRRMNASDRRLFLLTVRKMVSIKERGFQEQQRAMKLESYNK